MSDEQVEEYTRWFKSFDTDGSNNLSYEEMCEMLKDKGYPEATLQEMFVSVDTSGDKQISLEEFLTAMCAPPPAVHHESAMLRVCRSFDANGDGFIDKDELTKVFADMKRNLNAQEIDRMIQLVDEDGDGKIDYNELCRKVFHSDLQ